MYLSQSGKKAAAEFQFRQIPGNADILAMLGSSQIRAYGRDLNGRAVLNEHFHNLTEIGICRRGDGDIVSQGDRYPYEPGTIAVFPKEYSHQIISGHGEQSFWEFIYVNPADFLKEISFLKKRELSRYISQIESGIIIKPPKEFLIFERELDCLMDLVRMGASDSRHGIRGLLFAMLMEIVRTHSENGMPQPSDAWLEQEKSTDSPVEQNPEKAGKIHLALSFVDAHYMEDLKVADIAEAAFMSESYLRRIFAQSYKMSPLQYVNYVRIEAVCRILLENERNINEAARKAGFENMSTFIKNFRKVKGMTPTEWIKNQNN